MGEDEHEFFTTYQEWICILGLVDSRGANFTTYPLDGPTIQWWHNLF